MTFGDALAPEVTTIALCWRVARTDGVTLGFTSHDQAITVAGLRYEAAPGMTPSAISAGLGLDVATMEFTGALSAGAITEADLAAGRFDGAALQVFMVDWTAPAAGTLPVARGTMGEVARDLTGVTGSFTATVRGPTAAFDALAVETCSPTCRAELGDRRCRVDLAPRTVLATLAEGSTGDRLVVAGLSGLDRFVGGRVRPLDGPAAGIDGYVAATDGAALLLVEALPGDLPAGLRVELREGCDKRLATCVGRFGNAANFRGEPHVPGSDVLTRFPGV
ncbi:MAG: DUF2163 domain-containing protein [Sphingomonadaceae bacterium]|nr:DUF2163 domain-containing protein [Sphingomonadaceae bacterium]